MAKNDYRRSLIMLRGLEKGYGGHARLERRVLSGTLDFQVSAPSADEQLAAALVGPRGGRMVAKPVGRLKSDGRGQRALLASFDPRNIAGLDLNDTSAAVIARVDSAGVKPVLCGWLNGAKQLDWAEVERLLIELFGDSAGANTADETQTADETEAAGEPDSAAEAEPDSVTEVEPDSVIDTEPDAAAYEEPAGEEEPEAIADAEPEVDEEPAGEIESNAVAEEEPAGDAARVSPAGAHLDIDMSEPWPEDIESLRILFLTSPRYEPFQLDGYVFVYANMAEETGVDHCAVGVRAQNGQITGVCYAIPMAYTPEPPAGLEGYEWIGDQNRGYWVICDDLSAQA